jgi:hypothetical protein
MGGNRFGEGDEMPPTPYEPPSRRHRFDIVAYDQFDAPILVVEIKRSGDIRSLERLIEDTKQYVSVAARQAPFFLIATPQRIDLFKGESGKWSLAHTFDAAAVLCRYDKRYGEDPVYESYLASLIQVWLNDIAYNWHEGTPPETKVFEQLDVLNALRDGSMTADASL